MDRRRRSPPSHHHQYDSSRDRNDRERHSERGGGRSDPRQDDDRRRAEEYVRSYHSSGCARGSHRSHSDRYETARRHSPERVARDPTERSTRPSGSQTYREGGADSRYRDSGSGRGIRDSGQRHDYRSSDQEHRNPERSQGDSRRNYEESSRFEHERAHRDSDRGQTYRDSNRGDRSSGRAYNDREDRSDRSSGRAYNDHEDRSDRGSGRGYNDYDHQKDRSSGRSYKHHEGRGDQDRTTSTGRPFRDLPDDDDRWSNVDYRNVRGSDRSYQDTNRNENQEQPHSSRSRSINTDQPRFVHSSREQLTTDSEVRGRTRDTHTGTGGAERRPSSNPRYREEDIKRRRSECPESPDPSVQLAESMASMGGRRLETFGGSQNGREQREVSVGRSSIGHGIVRGQPRRTIGDNGVPAARGRPNGGSDGLLVEASGSSAPANPNGEGGRRGARRSVRLHRNDRFDNVCSRPMEMNSKSGTSGQAVSLIANFFPLRTKPSWCLFNYRVDFNPDEERTAIKKHLLRVHDSSLGGYIFDGSNMYTANRLDPEPMVLYSERNPDKEKIELTVRLVGEVSPGDTQYLQFYNIIVRSCLQILEFEELGRHFYDRHAAIQMQNHRLELWPGYITTLRNYENNLMLCVEVTHKVLRLDNCLSFINQAREERNFTQIVSDELVGTVVMTHYNRKTYRVDDIDWDKSPRTTFDHKGVSVSLADYYLTKYQIKIKDMRQPLFVSRPKKQDCHRGEAAPILLIPELCQLTGLSENIRKNYKVMRELSAYLQQPPERRVQNIQNFMTRLRGVPQIRDLLTNWGLEFENKLVALKGRVAPVEQVIFRLDHQKDMVTVGPGADWNFAFKNKSMFASMKMTRWAIIVTQRDVRGVDNLIHTMRTVSRSLDFHVPKPSEIVRVPDTKVQAFVSGVNQAVANTKDLDMIFIILPGQQHDLYSAVKKRCYVDYGIASQCFLAKHLQPNAKGLMSIVTKVIVQMNAKLGGEPWATNNPLKASHTMIVGFDVYHCGKRQGSSVGAMVCTTNKELSRYYSTVSFHQGRDELSDRLCTDMTKCVYAFRAKNEEALPDRIIMYRDGVGEGQLTYVYNTELDQIKTALKSVYKSANRDPPRFTSIVVTKKGNARIFHPLPNGHIKNPDAGTIVDNTITLPERYDFFLVAQASKQGTVSPTAYNVIWDEQGLDPDKIQRLTFKLCHLYYNWSGAVAVPGVCQYAHKLAYLTGLSLGSPANEKLSHELYFL